MRIEIPGPGNEWVELRGPEELTAADDDAWSAAVNQAWVERVQADRDREPEISEDGVSMRRPAPQGSPITAAVLERRRNDLLASLITAWSFDLPLPYSAEVRTKLPLAAGRALAAAIEPHVALLDEDAGPKEPEAPGRPTGTGGLANGSAEKPPSPLPDLTEEPPVTASTSSNTD